MSDFDKQATFQQILQYAEKRWCWDDTSFLEEMFEVHYNPKVDTPQVFVDDLAKDYDLTDPRDVNFGNDLSM